MSLSAPQPGPRICVLGAGPSGLAMARALLQQNLRNFVVYDRRRQIGGNWSLDQSVPTSVYEGLRTITSKRRMAFTGFPFPPEAPHYPTREDLLAYLHSFVRAYKLAPYLELGREIAEVSPESDGQWRVTLASGDSSLFDAVCISNGHHSEPSLPEIPGSFSGRIAHSHHFRSSFPFTGQRALVLGLGNSGADIAADLVRRNGRVTVSLRRGYHILPRYLFGIPSDEVLARLHLLPRPILARLAAILLRLLPGATTRQMPRPDHRLFETHPLINSDLPRFIASGAIRLRGPVAHAAGPTVTFADGAAEDFDLIVACTGYNITFPFLRLPANELPPHVPLGLRIFHPQHPGLFFIGLIQPSGSIWPLADLQARLVAKHLAGLVPAPHPGDDARYGRFVDSPRHVIEVDFFRYQRALVHALARAQ